MAAPTPLSGAVTTVTVDGTDLHTYGMIIESINNPVPTLKQSASVLPLSHGDIDFSKYYNPRYIIIRGSIIGDTAADFLSNVDSLKQFFRARQNGDYVNLIFNNQPTRQWSVKYFGEFSVDNKSLWYNGRTAAFQLRLKCRVPWAEKTTETIYTSYINQNCPAVINNPGNVVTPLKILMRPMHNVNLLEDVTANFNEVATTGKLLSNCTEAAQALGVSHFGFGDYCLEVTQTAGVYSVESASCISVIDEDKYYCFSGYVTKNLYAPTSYDNVTLIITQDGAGGNLASGAFGVNKRQWIKFGPTELSGVSSIRFGIQCTGAPNSSFRYDGFMVHAITEDEYDDDDWCPPPYNENEGTPEWPKLVSPIIKSVQAENVFENGHGDDASEWDSSLIFPISDPYSAAEKCLNVRATSAETGLSTRLFLNPNKTYKYYFKYNLTWDETSGDAPFFYAGLNYYAFKGEVKLSGTAGEVLKASSNNDGTTWQTAEGTFTPVAGTDYARFYLYFGATGGDTYETAQLLIKDILICEESVYTAYKKYQDTGAELSVTLDENDNYVMNSETLTQTFFDSSGNSIVNGAQYFTGDKIYANPGYNEFRITDARIGATTPSQASNGGYCKATISFRERYL